VRIGRQQSWITATPPLINHGQAGAGEASFKGLASIVFGNPDVFAGYWPLGDARNAAVVAAVRDPAEVWPRLETAFAYSRCVVRVEFSQAEIDATAGEIGRDHPGWITKMALEQNWVRVIVPVLDGDTLRELDRYPAASP
jgi:hypothetical protein